VDSGSGQAEKASNKVVDQETTPSTLPGLVIHLNRKRNFGQHTLFLLREFVALFVWAYAIVKVFIFDVDLYVVRDFLANWEWVLRYRLFVLVGLVAVVWLITGRKRWVPLWGLYILFYPLILLCWRLPVLVFKAKSWNLALAVFDSTVSFIKSFKYNFISGALFLVAAVVVLVSRNRWLLLPSVLGVAVILVLAYIVVFFRISRASSVFQILSRLLTRAGRRTPRFLGVDFSVDKSIRDLPVAQLDSSQLALWTGALERSVLFNRFCLYAARKLRDFESSAFIYVSPVSAILGLVILTVVSFALMNYGVFKVSNRLFEYAALPSIFTFVYYSFYKLVFGSVKEVSPVMLLSQVLAMIESFFGLVLTVILGTLLFTVRSKRRTDELSKAIRNFEERGDEMEGFIRDEFKVRDIVEATAELEKNKASMIRIIYWFTEGMS
jgi:hypothetical protein